jgi:glycosyltransferase involved in cell wall biosynthesis
MSRDLLVIGLFTIICIILSPLFKEQRTKKYVDSTIIKQESVNVIASSNFLEEKNITIRTTHSKSIVLLTDTFLPNSYAGSEISAYESIKYLRDRGHNIIVFIKDPDVNEFDGFKIYKYNPNSEFCKDKLINSDIVFFQMSDKHNSFSVIQERTKPIYISIHVANAYHWILTQKVSFPIVVIYNSHMTQNSLPTIHNNMRMIPYVNTKHFTSLRQYTIQNDVVCLINCAEIKGGKEFNEIVKRMKNTQFLGVKGGYSKQELLDPCPPNLTYMENQEDIRIVFKRIGILLMPSKSETWGRTAVEAMAAGVPVIHSEAGGLIESVGGAGVLCELNDIDSWCEAIQRIIADKAYRELLRQNGFRRVKEIEAEQIRGRQELAMKIETAE